VRRAIALAWALCACAPPAAPEPEGQGAEAGVVARVDGAAIRVEELTRLAAARGLSPEAALERLIDERLLEAEAERRGLQQRADVRLAPKRALAQLVLRDVEASVPDPADPEATRAALDALFERLFATTQVRVVPEALAPLLGGPQ